MNRDDYRELKFIGKKSVNLCATVQGVRAMRSGVNKKFIQKS